MAGVQFKLTGDDVAKNLFAELPKRVIAKGNRAAVTAMCKPTLRALKATAPRDSGATKKALGQKIKTYKGKGIVAGIMGAKKQGAKPAIAGDGEVKQRVPSRYLHLIEKGAKAHDIPQPKMNRVAKHPGATGSGFMEAAQKSTRSTSLAAGEDKMAEVILKEAKKLGKL